MNCFSASSLITRPQQRRFLVVVVAANEVGGRFAVRQPAFEPKP